MAQNADRHRRVGFQHVGQFRHDGGVLGGDGGGDGVLAKLADEGQTDLGAAALHFEEEIEEAEQEGVEFQYLVAPKRIIAGEGEEAGRVKALECLRMKLGEPDASDATAPKQTHTLRPFRRRDTRCLLPAPESRRRRRER